MFFYRQNPQQDGVRANDMATAVFTIAFLIFAVIYATNLMFQGFTKERIATGLDSAARYVATHKDEAATNQQVGEIMMSFIQSSFIKESDVNIWWTTNLAGDCAKGDVSACGAPPSVCKVLGSGENQAVVRCGGSIQTDGKYEYREPFAMVAEIIVPRVFGAPFIQDMHTVLVIRSAVEIVGP